MNQGFFDVTYAPNDEEPYALFVGAIDERKGVDLLVDAVNRLEGIGWKLRIAGSGKMRGELEAISGENIEWLGLLDWEALREQLVGARCLVLPTKADTSPNVVKEARVIGLPVVTTKHGGQGEYIFDGVNGRIVDPLDAAHLAECLESVMRDGDHAAELGRNRHKHDREYFSPRSNC